MEISEKKHEILKAASECFSRYGYEKTTLEDIGRLVGLNKASLYYYYKNKESIFGEVIFLEVDKALAKIKEELKNISGCKNKISTYIRSKINVLRELMNFHNLSVETIRSIQPIFKNLYGEVCECEVIFVSEILNTCIKNKEIKNCDAKKIAKIIITIMDAVKLKYIQDLNTQFLLNFDYEKYIEEATYTISLIIDGLKK